MNTLELYDSYESYYAGRESAVSTGHRDEKPDGRDQPHPEDDDKSPSKRPSLSSTK
jgi:hypothetical protein